MFIFWKVAEEQGFGVVTGSELVEVKFNRFKLV
jgi:hypothetical protein